jgi:hypothetical protein
VLVAAARIATTGLNLIWTLLTWTGWKSITMFIAHSIQCVLLVARVPLMVTALGIARLAMLAWQGAIWLVNAAMMANPAGLIIAGIVALVATVVLVIAYWDELKAALMDSAAFQWISGNCKRWATGSTRWVAGPAWPRPPGTASSPSFGVRSTR